MMKQEIPITIEDLTFLEAAAKQKFSRDVEGTPNTTYQEKIRDLIIKLGGQIEDYNYTEKNDEELE